MKTLRRQRGVRRSYIVPNNIEDEAEGRTIFEQFRAMTTRFLAIEVAALPSIPNDRTGTLCAALGSPVACHEPGAPASIAIRQLARGLQIAHARRHDRPRRESVGGYE